MNVPPPRGAARASIRPQASTPGHSLSLSCQPPPEHSPQEPGHPSSRPGAGAVPLCACVGHSHHPPSSGPLPGSATPGQPPPGEGATASGSLCSRRCPIWTSRPVTEPPGMPLTQPCRLDLHGHKGGFPRRPCGRGGAGAGEQGRGLSCLEDAAAGAANGQRHERTVVCCRLSGKEHSVFTGVAIVHCCSSEVRCLSHKENANENILMSFPTTRRGFLQISISFAPSYLILCHCTNNNRANHS